MKFGVLSYLSVNEKVLMMKKGDRKGDPNSGKYAIPGGHLEKDEIGMDNHFGRQLASIRETKEETGLRLISPIYRGLILFHNFEREFDNWPNPTDFLVYIYSANKYTGELCKEKDNEFPLWVDEKEIPSLPKNLGDELIYEWLNMGKFFTGVIKHKGKVLDEAGTFVDYF
jgi:8-oxo-dGTP pyrophosphatase MutT (NUDIX family)